MKILKYLLFLILILFIAGSIYVATKEGEYRVVSSRTINAPATLLYKEIVDLSNWKTWDGWKQEEGINLDLSENTTGEDATISWEADNMRDGRITTTSVIPNRKLEQKLVMKTSVGEASGEIIWTLEPAEDKTKVTWTLTGTQTFKEKLAFSLQDRDLTEIFQPIFEENLQDLEEHVIRKMEAYSINVDGVTEHGGGYYMYSTTAAKFDDVDTRSRAMIKQVRIFMEKNNIPISGNGWVIYNQRDERNSTSIFSAAVPTPSQVITPTGSEVLNGYLDPQRVVKTTLKGHRKNAPQAWESAYRYIEENELQVKQQGQPFEIYLTDPSEVDNPAEWITEIYIPVE